MANSSGDISYQSDVSHGTFQSTISQEKEKLRWDSDTELKKVSKSLLRLQKWSLLIGLLIINGTLIYVGVAYPEAYYIGVVLLTANTAFQVFMILCILAAVVWTKVISYPWRRKPENPETPERMVWLLPCYNENLEELKRSLGSLCAQKCVEKNPKFIMIVVDGNVRGPGMTKTTQQYLLQDVLGPGRLVHFENGYRAHDGLFMPVDVQTGLLNGIPYLFVGKRHNMGKRDSLCFARSFLYHFNKRSENTETMFNPQLFDFMGGTLVQSGLEKVDYLAGMDADTVFDDLCIHEMLQVLRQQPKLVAVCGHVCVDYAGKNWGPWSLYQGVEYSLTQGLRRTFQSIVTGKVNCLPGMWDDER
jgi:chitin synthase